MEQDDPHLGHEQAAQGDGGRQDHAHAQAGDLDLEGRESYPTRHAVVGSKVLLVKMGYFSFLRIHARFR